MFVCTEFKARENTLSLKIILEVFVVSLETDLDLEQNTV
jgi:hypothetical protein